MSESVEQRPSVDPGATASLTTTITEEDVLRFAEATGDQNPVHLDREVAAASIFGRRVAHGMLSASLISAVLGTQLPGPGTVYISQDIRFRRPVYLGDTVTASVTVTSVDVERHQCVLATSVHNESGEIVLDGEARVRMP
jgi:acyl dehydratase